ncbi:MAG: CHC2 zinc finger domain-containing protein [Anaerolineae bacterium]|nr:CHC2 zinc finger domain-containing protein [Anaerolineae bacterium]
MVDTKTLLERVDVAALIERDLGQPVRREGRWLKWTCPFHDDRKTPSLGVAGNRWKCFGCGRSGDAIDWVREREGLSFQEACQRLGSMELVLSSGNVAQPPQSESSAPSTAWQQRALAVVSACQAVLWSDGGTRARVWLNRRGLASETVRRWCLGFNPDDQKLCGLWVPRGIVIPCLVAGRIWYMKIRRANAQTKYSQVSGGQIALFGADTIDGYDTVVVTEGEFDAMLLHQETGDLVGVVTLGSAAARLPDAWVPCLLGVQRLLVAYDTDAAGAEGAARWESICPHAQRIVPLAGKDVTDFYLAGGDLRAWVQFALAADGEPTGTPVEAQVPLFPAAWEGQRVRIEDLPDLQAKYGLRVVGGDPDLNGQPWQPKIYLVEDKT